jgi:hypothetical protein
MKKLITLTICLMAAGMAFAQQSTTTKKKLTPAEQYTAAHKTAVGGYIRDARNAPIADVRVFVYRADSSAEIISSGYTDATGYYETNFTYPGKYNLKVVYPEAKSVMVSGVIIKKGITNISLNANPPVADTALPYPNYLPKPVQTKKTVNKKPSRQGGQLPELYNRYR